MILVQWSCKVPQEKLKSFIQFCKDELKPFYESHGCRRWELFMPAEVMKRYFPYQTAQEGNRYIEQAVFNSIEDFESLLETAKRDIHASEIMQRFGKEFDVSSCTFTILTQRA